MESAVRAGVIYSLLVSCKASNVDPRMWLEDVLNKIPDYENGKKDMLELLPGNWGKSDKSL